MNLAFGGFNNLSESYSHSRRGIPRSALKAVAQRLNSTDGIILDLGCGTGISTRQLQTLARMVVGVDPAPAMLKEAFAAECLNCSFALGSAENIPFGSAYFDSVVCMSSFHWFSNHLAVNEIRRVLKPSSSLIVVNKNELDDFRTRVKLLISNLVGYEIASAKENYEPEAFLRRTGFTVLERNETEYTEKFTLPDAIQYAQSFSCWNQIRPDQIDVARKRLSALITTKSELGYLNIKTKVVVISAKNPMIN